jgi:hypothetical protein
MKLALPALLLVLTSCAALQTAPASAPHPSSTGHDNRFSIYLGGRSLDEDDYSPVEDQGMIGFEFVHEPPTSAIGFEVGIAGSGDEDGAVEASTGELYAGFRKTFGDQAVHPYIGGGLAYIASEVEVGGADDDDASAAAYVHGGVQFDITDAFFVGVDLRVLFGSDLEIGGVDTDADYGQLALVLGFAF